jgi:hydrogenase maturation protease
MRWSGTNRSVLVIGYGNSLRRDDGAGLILANNLYSEWQASGLPVSLITAHQLDPELADDIARSDADIILFTDAAVLPESDTPASDAHASFAPTIQLSPVSAETNASTIGHHLTPAAVMLYATQLFGFNGNGWLLCVPGYDFGHGEGLSEKCQRQIDVSVAQNYQLWTRIQTQSALL